MKSTISPDQYDASALDESNISPKSSLQIISVSMVFS